MENTKMPPPLRQRLQAMDKALEALLLQLEAYDDEQLNRPPGPGRWSAMQVLQHLMLAEKLSQQYIVKKQQSLPGQLPSAGLGTWWREMLVWLFLSLPFKRKAPAMVAEGALPAYATLAATAAEWRQQRQQLQELLAGLDPALHRKAFYRHPVAGSMTTAGMLDFFRWHIEHHRRQLRECLGA
jgi:hypothetical protein